MNSLKNSTSLTSTLGIDQDITAPSDKITFTLQHVFNYFGDKISILENEKFHLSRELARVVFQQCDESIERKQNLAIDTFRKGASISNASAETGDVVFAFKQSAHPDIANKYCELTNEGINEPKSREMMMNVTPDVLKERNANVVVAFNKANELIGGLHWTEENGNVTFRGAIVKPEARGRKIGQAIVATGVQQAMLKHGTDINMGCTTRVLVDDTDNYASIHVFARSGFVTDFKIHNRAWANDAFDAHLADSIETNTDGNMFTRFRKLTATKATETLVREFLANW